MCMWRVAGDMHTLVPVVLPYHGQNAQGTGLLLLLLLP
jgi:hypothetical protein